MKKVGTVSTFHIWEEFMKHHFNRQALSRMSKFQLEWLLRCYISELCIYTKRPDLQSQIALVKTALGLKCAP